MLVTAPDLGRESRYSYLYYPSRTEGGTTLVDCDTGPYVTQQFARYWSDLQRGHGWVQRPHCSSSSGKS